LEFHKKKQAVNTLSTTQVRKGVYRDSLQAWRKYEEQLQPLVNLIGDRTNYDLKTSLPGYTAPVMVEAAEVEEESIPIEEEDEEIESVDEVMSESSHVGEEETERDEL
jgi:hypothetical protein